MLESLPAPASAGHDQQVCQSLMQGGSKTFFAASRLLPQQIGRFEHPYAGWLYAGGWIRAEHADGSDVAVGLDVGCLGPCSGGKETQELAHHLLNQPRPRGWARRKASPTSPPRSAPP